MKYLWKRTYDEIDKMSKKRKIINKYNITPICIKEIY